MLKEKVRPSEVRTVGRKRLPAGPGICREYSCRRQLRARPAFRPTNFLNWEKNLQVPSSLTADLPTGRVDRH